MSPGIQLQRAERTTAMPAKQERPATPAEHLHDPERNTYRYVHLPDVSWICQHDPPEFDDALLQSLEQKRQELDAKVARYIAKKQGQFSDYVAEKHRRYGLRTEDRRQRREKRDAREHAGTMEEAGDDGSSAPQVMEDDNEARWFTKQREEDARKRAAMVSEEVAKSETPPIASPDIAAQGLGSVRERDSEILQLLPGFLPLLEDQEQLSSSAPAVASRGDSRQKNPRAELVRSSTMPNPTIKRSPVPRRSSLKQSNGDRPGSARKAVRLSLGPRIVTPTQSPPDDNPLNFADSAAQVTFQEEAHRKIEDEVEDANRWKFEPERVYTEEIPSEELLAVESSQELSNDDGASVSPRQVESPPQSSPEKGKEKSLPISETSSSAGAAPQKEPSPPQSRPSYSESPLNFSKEEIPQRPTASLGRRSSLTEEAKAAPKEPRKRKKKKVKAQVSTGLQQYTPSRSTTTTALSSTAPEVGTSSARSISTQYAKPSSYSTSLLSSSFVDSNNTGIFYPTRARPPPSHLKPDEASLSAVNVPLPVGGFSSESPTVSYPGSALHGASLGESYMALHFARRMAEREKKLSAAESGNRKNSGKDGVGTSIPPLLKEEDEDDVDSEAERVAKRREEKYKRNKVPEEDEFAGELDL